MMNPLQSPFGAALPGSAILHARSFAAGRGPVFARPPTDGFEPGGGGTGLVRSASSQLAAREQRLREYLGRTDGVGHSLPRRTFDVAVKDVPRIVLGGLLVFPGCVTVVATAPLAMLLASASGGPDHGKIGYVMLAVGVPVLGYMLLQSGWHAIPQHWTSDDRAIAALRNPETHLNVEWSFYERLRNGYGGLSMPQRVAFITAIVERIHAVDEARDSFVNQFLQPSADRDFLFTVAPTMFEELLIGKASLPNGDLAEYAALAIAYLLPEFSPANRPAAIEALFSNMALSAREGFFNSPHSPHINSPGKAQALGNYAQSSGDQALLTRLVDFLTVLRFSAIQDMPDDPTPDARRLEALQTALRYYTMRDTGPLTENDQARARLVAQALRELNADLHSQYGPEARVAGRCASELWTQLDQWAVALEKGQRIPKSATGLRRLG